MSTLYDFSRQIKELCKEKKHTEALNFFKSNKEGFESSLIASNNYLIADMLTCLRHTNHFDAGYKFLKYYGIVIDDKTPEIILSAYAWFLYGQFKYEHSSDLNDVQESFSLEEDHIEVDGVSTTVESDLIVKIQETMQLLANFNSDYAKNALTFLFNIVLKVEKNKPRTDWNFIVSFCEKISPDKLSNHCSSIKVDRKGVIKDMELASARESWYAFMTKGLFVMKNFEHCFELSKQALESFDTFHYSNDLWFARRLALCKKEMGNTDEAIVELEAILKKKKEWFILKELAEMYLEKGNMDKAYSFALEGLSAYGDLEYKVELLELTGLILNQKEEKLLSYQHLTLVALIREENQWKLNEKLLQTLNEFHDMPLYKVEHKSELIKLLSAFWRKQQPQHLKDNKKDSFQHGKHYTGTITKLLNPTEKGKQGFITKDSGGEVYFFIFKEDEIHEEIKIGLKVSFKTAPDKKGKGDRAVSITKID